MNITVADHTSKLSCLDLTDSYNFSNVAKVPTLLLCNVAGFRRVPKFYHTERDTIDVLDWESFVHAVNILDVLVTHCK